MKLITELHDALNYLTEEKDGKKNCYIEGIFMQSEIKNRNGRLYPRSVMENAVNNYLTEKVANKNAFGELGHPSGPQINLDRVSHIIESLRFSGNDVIGKARVLDTPMGTIAQKIMEGGGKIGVSSRGLGSLKSNKEGIHEVQNDFRLATAADIVADPSAPSAFVKGIMENKEWFYDVANAVWIERTVEAVIKEDKKGKINEEVALRLFQNMLQTLSEQKKR